MSGCSRCLVLCIVRDASACSAPLLVGLIMIEVRSALTFNNSVLQCADVSYSFHIHIRFAFRFQIPIRISDSHPFCSDSYLNCFQISDSDPHFIFRSNYFSDSDSNPQSGQTSRIMLSCELDCCATHRPSSSIWSTGCYFRA